MESAAHDGIDLAWDRVLRGEEGGLVPSSARIPGNVMPSFQGCAGAFPFFLPVDRINLTYAAATMRLNTTRGAVCGEAHLVH